jgi:hypothetical protein
VTAGGYTREPRRHSSIHQTSVAYLGRQTNPHRVSPLTLNVPAQDAITEGFEKHLTHFSRTTLVLARCEMEAIFPVKETALSETTSRAGIVPGYRGPG